MTTDTTAPDNSQIDDPSPPPPTWQIHGEHGVLVATNLKTGQRYRLLMEELPPRDEDAV